MISQYTMYWEGQDQIQFVQLTERDPSLLHDCIAAITLKLLLETHAKYFFSDLSRTTSLTPNKLVCTQEQLSTKQYSFLPSRSIYGQISGSCKQNTLDPSRLPLMASQSRKVLIAQARESFKSINKHITQYFFPVILRSKFNKYLVLMQLPNLLLKYMMRMSSRERVEQQKFSAQISSS